MASGVIVGVYHAFFDCIIALHGPHAVLYKFALAEIVHNGGSQGKGLATYPCEAVKLLGPAANLAIPVLDE